MPASTCFDRAQLAALGWSPAAVTRAVRAGRLVALRRGQFCLPTPASRDDERRARARAAARACTGSAISHRSGLLEHRLPVVGSWSGRPSITVPPGHRGSLDGADLHRATLRPLDVVEVDAAPVTSPARTLIDVARSLPTGSAVAALDAGLHRAAVTAEELDDVAHRCRNWPGIRRARRALTLVDARAESPLESISRLTIVRLGLPAPESQLTVFDPYGRILARLDFYWDEFGVAGEADGALKYRSDDGAVPLEKERQELVESYGIVFARWGWEHVRRQVHEVRRRVEAAFERGRRRDLAGFPREWSVGRLEPSTREERRAR